VTPLVIAPTGHTLGVPSLTRNEGVTFLHDIPPRATGLAMTTTSTPLRLGVTLRHSSVPLSDGAGALPWIILAPSIQDSDPGGFVP
jgi:hypothetical protein